MTVILYRAIIKRLKIFKRGKKWIQTILILNYQRNWLPKPHWNKRDASKLLVIDPVTKEMTDTHFDHIIDQLNPGDALVMNNTRVLPARLYGEKPDTHGHVEFLLLKNTQGDQWEVLAKPAKTP